MDNISELILKDRANTGRLLDSLEEKQYITRTLIERNNRPIKQVKLTKSGQEFLDDTLETLKERLFTIGNTISEKEIEQTRECLFKLREALAKIIHTQI